MTDGPSPAPPAPKPHGRLTHWFVGISAALSLVIAAGSAYGFVAYQQAKGVGTVKGFGTSDVPDDPNEPDSPGGCADDVCNYLLLGSDSREGLSQEEQTEFGTDQQIGGENRADTIILVHTDPKLEKAIIVSFPRDLYVEIPGHGEDKINAAFEGGVEGGGPTLVANTVQQLTGLKIDHFLYVDLAGFQGVIDELDGVDMCITGENVNTPGYVESETADGTISEVYYNEPGHIVDPRTGLDVKPGCQRLPSDQALAYVRTRHLKCDSAAPDFYRIQRQQQFLRSVINRLLQPEQLAQLPLMIKPILSNLRRDEGLNPAELAYLTGQLQGISSGATEFRTVPAYPDPSNLGILRMDQSADRIFAAIRQGKALGTVGEDTVYTPPSEATVPVLVVDHASGGKVTQVTDVLSQAGFDITPGVTSYPEYPKKLAGNVIAYAPDADAKAQVVAKYFPSLELQEVEGLPDDVVVFVDATYKAVPVGGGSTDESTCPEPNV
ncbi:MAG TPA: LCP family protein [Actinomycetota bacterium]|nr:LCP family protein [Actinomycetota bacterium]